MKRILAVLLSVLVLASSLAVSALAFEKPLGSAAGSTVPELTLATAFPGISKLISASLTSSEYCSIKSNTDIDWKSAANISEANQADIANHYKYGFSVAGVSKLQRAVYGAVDSVWTTGNLGSNNSAGAPKNGAFAFYLNEYLYNYKGEKVLNPEYVPQDENVKVPTEVPEGYVYQMLMTFNFGCIAELDSFGYYGGGKSMIQAADIYISNDGDNWTLIGYYDRVQKLIDGSDYKSTLNVSVLGEDVTGKTGDADLTLFQLPAGTKAQFLRIAANTGVSTKDTYAADSEWGTGLLAWNHATSYHTWREMFVFGTKTDEIGYIYDENKDSVESDSGEDTEEVTAPPIITKPKDEETTADNGSNPDSKTEETTDPDDSAASGCGSSVTFSVAMLASIAIGAGVACNRRKKK